MENIITPDNWTNCFFTLNDLKAFISIGADPEHNSEITFYVTLTNKDHEEIFQTEYQSLDEAIKVINQKYQEWNFTDTLNPQSGGCDSCGAH